MAWTMEDTIEFVENKLAVHPKMGDEQTEIGIQMAMHELLKQPGSAEAYLRSFEIFSDMLMRHQAMFGHLPGANDLVSASVWQMSMHAVAAIRLLRGEEPTMTEGELTEWAISQVTEKLRRAFRPE